MHDFTGSFVTLYAQLLNYFLLALQLEIPL